jgi:hypothetical protein
MPPHFPQEWTFSYKSQESTEYGTKFHKHKTVHIQIIVGLLPVKISFINSVSVIIIQGVFFIAGLVARCSIATGNVARSAVISPAIKKTVQVYAVHFRDQINKQLSKKKNRSLQQF